jgi:hypothetical protein
MPATGSDFDMGHRYLDEGLFLDALSPLVVGAGTAVEVELGEDVEPVDEVEANDETDEDEFDRVAVFRGGISILETSSALIELMPLEEPLPELHVDLDRF